MLPATIGACDRCIGELTLSAELYETIIRIVDERVAEIKISREMYDRLVAAVADLAEAQKRTEQRIDGLAKTVGELAEAQKRTEQRIDGLAKTVGELAEAQKRTEFSLSNLGERVTRLEASMEKLAEAQKRTEQSLHELSRAVAGLGETVGFGLEDVAKVVLPSWLERHERLMVESLERRFLEVEGEKVEVNLYGVGAKGKAEVHVVGEVKSRINLSDVREFASKLDQVRKTLPRKKILSVMFGYWIHPAASAAAKNLGIQLVASYQR